MNDFKERARAGLERVFESPETATTLRGPGSIAAAIIEALGRTPTACCAAMNLSLGAFCPAGGGPIALAKLRCASCGHESGEIELSKASITLALENGRGLPDEDMPVKLAGAWELSFDLEEGRMPQ